MPRRNKGRKKKLLYDKKYIKARRRNETVKEKEQRAINNRAYLKKHREQETQEKHECDQRKRRRYQTHPASAQKRNQLHDRRLQQECRKRKTMNAKCKQMNQSHREQMTELTVHFEMAVKEGPVFICTCCHRLLYRHSVLVFYEKKYIKVDSISSVFETKHRKESIDQKEWICKKCHNILKKGSLPNQADANGLMLDNIPDELGSLNSMEIRLIAKRIAFMKMVLLPRGKQRKIIGPAVNIPTNLTPICTLLPHLPATAQIIALKLKRKLEYKGHYMYQFIRPEKIFDSLHWLKNNNPLYFDVEINQNWETEWNNNEPEMWEALLRSPLEDEYYHTRPTEVTDELWSTNGRLCTNNYIHNEQLQCKYSYDSSFLVRYKQLEDIAQSRNFKVINVALDGDCLFHAVRLQMSDIGKQDTTTKELRNQLAEYMEYGSGYQYKQFISCTNIKIPSNAFIEANVDRWNEYLKGLKSSAWGDHYAVQGLSDMLFCNIEVITENPNNPPIEIYPITGKSNVTIYLGLIQDIHYTALVPIEKINTYIDNEIIDSSFGIKTNQCDDIQFESYLQPENYTFSLAPGEGGKPMYILDDKNFEEMAYPTHFPKGKGGFSYNRHVKLTARCYFQQRLLNCDTRFAKDVEYLLASQYAVECKQVCDSASIRLRQTKGQLLHGQTLNAVFFKNQDNVKQLIRTDQAYTFLKNIRGSPVFWQNVLFDLFAYLRQKGKPAIFLTLSSADLHWPDVIQIIALQHNINYSIEDIENMNFEERSKWLRTNPVTAARHFHYRMETFVRTFLYSKLGPLGELFEIVIRIEFQARGSPHAHSILWIKNAPKLKDDEEKVIQFIDQLITCHLPTEVEDYKLRKLVQKLQTHVHSSACKKNQNCRFNFPKPPTCKTLIAKAKESQQDVDKANIIVKKIFNQLHLEEFPEDISIADFLKSAKVSETDYYEAISTSKRGNNVILKREVNERWINNYNPDIMRAWKANMDIQYITDEYACVMYVASYMMKAEKAMGQLLKDVANDYRSMELKHQMNVIKGVFLNHREVSAQEAAYRLLSLPLKKMSSKVVFINTNPKECRVKIMKPMNIIKNMTDDDEDIFYLSISDKYAARPDFLENICLAEFAANYNTKKFKTNEPEDVEHDITNDNEINTTSQIDLKYGLGTMQKRQKEAIIRFHRYNEKKEHESYYRAQLMLYLPWRDEDLDLKTHFLTYEASYNNNTNIIQGNIRKYNINADAIEVALNSFEVNGPPEHVWMDLAPNTEHEQLVDKDCITLIERQMEQQDLDDNAELLMGIPTKSTNNFYTTEINKSDMNYHDYCEMMRSLNIEQRELIDYHRKWCKTTILDLKEGKVPTPYHIFLSGPGGVGKSHLIKLIHYDTKRLIRLAGHTDPDDIISLLTAPTGVAAFNISGMTIHSAFCFKPFRFGFNYLPLSHEKLPFLEKQFQNLQLLIIDEISMVGADTLLHIYRRLCEIKRTKSLNCNENNPFGNISVLAVGDLFQLPPVRQNHVFRDTRDKMANICGNGWDLFKLFELHQTTRQKNDKPFAELLNRVREGNMTDEDVEMLKTRQISTEQIIDLQDILHVYAINKYVNEHNSIKLNSLGKNIFHIKANDKCKNDDTMLFTVDSTSCKVNDRGGLTNLFSIAIGAKVMLNVNIDVTDGLVNGARGFVQHIDFNDQLQHVNAILVKFDHIFVGVKAKLKSAYKNSYPDAVPIFKFEAILYHGIHKAVSTRRIQFPLSLAWALTIHKVQGLTVDRIIVSMKGPYFNAGQAYVAFSRVKNLNDLYITDFDQEKIKVDIHVQEEMNRLRETSLKLSSPNSFFPPVPPLIHTLKIGLLNVNGYLQHLDDITSDHNIHMLDIIAFTETHLKDESFSTIKLPGLNYNILRKDRIKGNGGGLMFLTNKSYQIHKEELFFSENLEYLSIVLNVCIELRIVLIYREPKMKFNIFRKSMKIMLEEISKTPTLIIGDFNDDLLKTKEAHIDTLFSTFHFKQLVNSPTTDHGSLLDHVYYNNDKEHNITIEVKDTYYSDHDLIMIYLSKEQENDLLDIN